MIKIEDAEGLEEKVNKHYTPLEYKIALTIYSEQHPYQKDNLDYCIRILSNPKTEEWKYKMWEEEFFKLLCMYRLDMGDTIFNMYLNIYNAIKDGGKHEKSNQ